MQVNLCIMIRRILVMGENVLSIDDNALSINAFGEELEVVTTL